MFVYMQKKNQISIKTNNRGIKTLTQFISIAIIKFPLLGLPRFAWVQKVPTTEVFCDRPRSGQTIL